MTKRTQYLQAWTALALALLVVSAAQPSVVAQSCPVSFNTTGSIAAGDATQSNRVTRNGVPSDCNGKAFPGLNDGAPQIRRFDQYNFTNTNATPACIQVTFTGTISGLHSVAYLNSFDPANVQTNYVGDLGIIYAANTTATYSFTVPAMTNFVVVVNETVTNGQANTYTLTVGSTTAPPPTPTVGQVLISEFRLAGAGASGAGTVKDEFIELYNKTDGPLSIGGFRLRAFDPNFFGPGDGADFTTTLPAGTTIPARGHFLVADTSTEVESYSLAAYSAPDFPITCGAGCDFFIDNEGIEFITPTAAAVQGVIDSVGFTGSGGRPGEVIVYGEGTRLSRRTQTNPTSQNAYVRKMTNSIPQDTFDNAADFELISVDGAVYPLAAGGTQASKLGGPGPERTTSPIWRNTAQVPVHLLDSTVGGPTPPNRVRSLTPVTNGTFGTLTIRRRFVNNTGGPITTLRFRVVNITTFPSPVGTADLRLLTSTDTTATGVNDSATCAAEGLTPPCTVTIRGTTLEEPPNQSNGGGLNSSVRVLSVTTAPVEAVRGRAGRSNPRPVNADGTFDLNVPLTNGSSINVQFTLGVQQLGQFLFFVNLEALP